VSKPRGHIIYFKIDTVMFTN